MSSSHLPPTPASSTDIRGKEKLVSLAPVLSLGPSAYADASSDRAASSTPTSNASDSSYHPHSPVVDSSRRKSNAAQSRPAKADDNDFALPPPPTRNRKIIQMKPKTAEKQQAEETEPAGTKSTGGRKKGNGNGATAASRKVARKTAHSLIERRRRSKMNEEFGVLKDMIPACQGQEMHKLAILQASIEYLRYLERCVTDLKASNTAARQPTSIPQSTIPTPSHPSPEAPHETIPRPQDEDQEMSDTHSHPSTGASTPNPLSQIQSRDSVPSLASVPAFTHNYPTISPAIPSSEYTSSRHYSISSTSAPSFSPYIHSAHASPYFAPTMGQHDPAPFALTSPALRAQDARGGNMQERERREKELDQEAMTALLMLNADRRSSKGRGMSVKDLLSN